MANCLFINIQKGYKKPKTVAQNSKDRMMTGDGMSPLPSRPDQASSTGMKCAMCGHHHKPGSICSYTKSDLLLDLLKHNPYHEGKGKASGGQFTTKDKASSVTTAPGKGAVSVDKKDPTAGSGRGSDIAEAKKQDLQQTGAAKPSAMRGEKPVSEAPVEPKSALEAAQQAVKQGEGLGADYQIAGAREAAQEFNPEAAKRGVVTPRSQREGGIKAGPAAPPRDPTEAVKQEIYNRRVSAGENPSQVSLEMYGPGKGPAAQQTVGAQPLGSTASETPNVDNKFDFTDTSTTTGPEMQPPTGLPAPEQPKTEPKTKNQKEHQALQQAAAQGDPSAYQQLQMQEKYDKVYDRARKKGFSHEQAHAAAKEYSGADWGPGEDVWQSPEAKKQAKQAEKEAAQAEKNRQKQIEQMDKQTAMQQAAADREKNKKGKGIPFSQHYSTGAAIGSSMTQDAGVVGPTAAYAAQRSHELLNPDLQPHRSPAMAGTGTGSRTRDRHAVGTASPLSPGQQQQAQLQKPNPQQQLRRSIESLFSLR